MSTVHLVPASSSDDGSELARKIGLLWEAAGLAECFRENDLSALKLHVGEPGTKTYVKASVVAALVALMQGAGAQPFLTDTAVLYKSPRNNGAGHTRVALRHGFTLTATGAPFVPADGLSGTDEVVVEVGGRHFGEVSIASAIRHARSMLVLTHATGHLGTGFGGAIKNLGMGCCSRKAKLRQHHGQLPRIDEASCTACGTCAEWCPEGAILVGETASIDEGKCIGCGECIAACLDGAVTFDWSIMGRELSERIVEHALGAAAGKDGRVAYVTAVMDVTRNCDCLGVDEEPLLPDVGILASRDPVAIDRAALDLIRERAGRPLEALSYPDRDGSLQIGYAAELGLGSAEVELVTVEA